MFGAFVEWLSQKTGEEVGMEGKLKISFIGDSHIAYWPFESYFPKWECYNYGVPGKGLDYVEMFHKDVSDSYVVVQLGTNDIYNLNTENMDVYVERYVKAVGAISSRGTYLFCIFPRNDFMDGTAVNCFIALLNGKIREKIKEETNVVYLDVFDKLLLNDKLNPDLTIDDLHLNGAGYRILVYTLRDLFLTDR